MIYTLNRISPGQGCNDTVFWVYILEVMKIDSHLQFRVFVIILYNIHFTTNEKQRFRRI